MKLGVVYPQTDVRGEASAIVDIGRAVESLGFDGITFYDHVAGADHADRDPALWGPYTDTHPFHDVFVALGALAVATERIELATGVLVLGQRQTVLAARQAADVDLLSNGRLRLGVGVGWNWVEYEALGVDFATRGRRVDEQIEVLRALWSEPLVTFHGDHHRLERVAITPRPTRPIPLWVGGFSEPAYRRAGRLGEGFVFGGAVEGAIAALATIHGHVEAAGRSVEGFGAELIVSSGDLGEMVDAVQRWREAGGTHASVVTMGLGLDTAAAQIDHLGAVREALA